MCLEGGVDGGLGNMWESWEWMVLKFLIFLDVGFGGRVVGFWEVEIWCFDEFWGEVRDEVVMLFGDFGMFDIEGWVVVYDVFLMMGCFVVIEVIKFV